ncbi:hypothetical protein [Desulfovibrio sp. JC022]|uniref:hypothetical protein n=1 Tax=Desulfovibrio sp. JC022 TaxID=2593642 RepID=UPI0013D6DADB|nr:hypothetical protein [Desulfovibrio sp. JC022]NDV21568.1 hypothetical protein [Desulfovibrio sp. JC022]
MMKIFRIVLLACIIATLSCSAAFAGSGKAIVPHWLAVNYGKSNAQSSNIFITNITQHDLVVKVTVYNRDSTIFLSGIEYKNFQNNNTEIGAGKTVNLKINGTGTTESDYGYAVIEWVNKEYDDDVVGLVSWANWRESSNRGYSVPVNNGMPF